MTSHTAEEDHLLEEDTKSLVPETQLNDSPNTFSQIIIKRLVIRTIVRKVDAATPNTNTDYKLCVSSTCVLIYALPQKYVILM